MVSFEHNGILWFLLLIVPAFFYCTGKFNAIMNSLLNSNMLRKNPEFVRRLKHSFWSKIVLRMLAFACFVLALAGISWGMNAVPVQKNGKAITMVFDISNSMDAADAPDDMTRLQSASSYARELMSKLDDTSFSVILTKGDSQVAIPMTDDRESVQILLDNISTNLLTSQGSGLGGGVQLALDSFPAQSSQASIIWLFTDGEETDDSLSLALENALKLGVPVTIIGFGSEQESEILAGDGKTKVKTALRTGEVEKTVAAVNRKYLSGKHSLSNSEVRFVDASEVGSAWTIFEVLENISKKKIDGLNLEVENFKSEDEVYVEIELGVISRRRMFLLLSLLLLMLSVITSKFEFRNLRKNRILGAAIVAGTLFFTGCSARFSEGYGIFQGKIDFDKKDYQKSTADFLKVYVSAQKRGDVEFSDYALYGLGVSYLAQGNADCAMEKFSMISDSANDRIRFAVLYNSGIIAHRQGDYRQAAEKFRKALEIDGTSKNAKINLELSLKEKILDHEEGEESGSPESYQSSDNKALENAVYSIIRENEEEQWKSRQQHIKTSELDY